jgi:hypothetical protein
MGISAVYCKILNYLALWCDWFIYRAQYLQGIYGNQPMLHLVKNDTAYVVPATEIFYDHAPDVFNSFFLFYERWFACPKNKPAAGGGRSFTV